MTHRLSSDFELCLWYIYSEIKIMSHVIGGKKGHSRADHVPCWLWQGGVLRTWNVCVPSLALERSGASYLSAALLLSFPISHDRSVNKAGLCISQRREGRSGRPGTLPWPSFPTGKRSGLCSADGETASAGRVVPLWVTLSFALLHGSSFSCSLM